MSLSTDDMEPRLPNDNWTIPASVFVAAFGGAFVAVDGGTFGIVFEVVALILMAWALFRFDRVRCELSYWNGRCDEDDWHIANRRRYFEMRPESLSDLIGKGSGR